MAYTIANKEDHCTLVNSINHRHPEIEPCVDSRTLPLPIKHLLLQQEMSGQILISHTHHHDRNRRVHQVEDQEVDGVNGTSAREAIEELIPEQQDSISLEKGKKRRETVNDTVRCSNPPTDRHCEVF